MKKPISSEESSWPSRFLWMTSTARTLFLPDPLEVGPEIPFLALGNGSGRLRLRGGRRRARGGGQGQGGEDLVHELLLVVLARLPLRDVTLPVVVGVVAGATGDLGHLASHEARDVVVQEQAAPRAVVVDDVAEPDGAVCHGALRARGAGSILAFRIRPHELSSPGSRQEAQDARSPLRAAAHRP